MAKHDTVTLSVDRFYDRLAWLVWKGMNQEANALRDFAAWFEPPIRIDERRVDRRVAKYSADEGRNSDPMTWS